MLKFLRKYQTWLLAVGGVLLMIVFVAPQAVQQFGPNPLKRTAGTLDGREIKVIDLERAQRELAVLERLLPGFPQSWRVEQGDSEHWMLLAESAERAGLVGGVAAWDQLAPQLAEQTVLRSGVARGTPGFDTAYAITLNNIQNQRLSLAGNMRITGDRGSMLERFDMTIAKALGVQRLLTSYYGAPRISESRLITAGRRDNDSVTASVFVAPADIIDLGWTPNEEAITQQYERYQGVRPGEAEDGTPFGYLLPPRVKLRWMMIERNLLRDAVTIDPIEVRKRWQRNKETYGEDFAVARDQIENEIRDEAADRLLTDANRLVVSEVLAATRRLDRDGEYLALPDNWSESAPDFNDIAAKVETLIEEELGMDLRRPGVGALLEWNTLAELGTVAVIGRSTAQVGPRRLSFPGIVSQTRELEPETSILNVQVGVPFVEYPLRDVAGNYIYFMVTDARTESEPDSVKEIRPDLARDARRRARYDALSDRLDSFLTAAKAGSLRSLRDDLNEAAPDPTEAGQTKAQAELVDNVQVRRAFTFGSQSVSAEAIRVAVMDRAAGIDPMLTDDEIPEDVRFVPIQVPERLSVAIAEIKRVTPLTEEELVQRAPSIIGTAISGELPRIDEGPFAKPALAKRLGWTPVATEDDDDAAE